MIKKFTPEKIEKLNKNEIFVFGSNIQGEHVGGAAWAAFQYFGAEMSRGFGYQGQSYAIPTCIRLNDENGKRYTKPFDNVNQIKPYVEAFINEAKQYKQDTFFVTKIGCGIAGFKVSEVAELFRPCLELENVVLPKEFLKWLLYPVVIANVRERKWVCGKDYEDKALMDFVMNNIDANIIDKVDEKDLDDILDMFYYTKS